MPYATIDLLDQLWNLFEDLVKNIIDDKQFHLSDIKKLMTASAVIDLSLHDIYLHTKYVHQFTNQLINLKLKDNLNNNNINECCNRWLEILKARNMMPLQVKHHKLLNGECDFRFTLQLMEGKGSSFKEIQRLNADNKTDLAEAMTAMHRLDCLTEGISFARLPLMDDVVLSDLMRYKDVICLLAKDQHNQIIGYCWGILLRNVEVEQKKKVNVFWIMDLARDPDFADDHIKIGEQLRSSMFEMLKSSNDCDFVGYQHLMNHKFHMKIISDVQDDNEQISFHSETFPSKTRVVFNHSLGVYVRVHFIQAREHHYAYPDYESLQPALFNAFWQAAHSVKDFMCGIITFFGRAQYHKLTHSIINDPIEERLVSQISNEQQGCDQHILKTILLSSEWQEQGKSIFSSHVPSTMQIIQPLIKNDDCNFQIIKAHVQKSGSHLMRSKLTTMVYDIIKVADSPTFVVNHLLKNQDTPKEWVDIISNTRHLMLGEQYNVSMN